MSKTVQISSTSQFNRLLETSKIVVADFYADWCGPCKTIAPLYEQFSAKLSRPNKITFVKVDTEKQQELARTYSVTGLPTFMIFKNKKAVSTIQGANSKALLEAVEQLEVEGGTDGAGSWEAGSGSTGWLGSDLPRGYNDVTDQVDLLGLDLLNSNSDLGEARTLFDVSKPSALDRGKGKGNAGAGETKKDWVESDTDEQLMLYIPFQATLKIHSLHITSLPPNSSEGDAPDELPMRPKTIQIYSNRAHVLGFEEAEDVPATQAVTLQPQDWDDKTGTAKIELRFVKFQNVSSLVMFVLDGEGDGEKVRVDRLRIVGETGEKRDLGKLEKIGDQSGE